MKQLLLLFAIHFIIFHQQKKDKKEKFIVTLEKKSITGAKSLKNWKFSPNTKEPVFDSLYSSPKLVTYNFRDYSYLMASQ